MQIDFHVCGEVNERTEKIRLFCENSQKGVLLLPWPSQPLPALTFLPSLPLHRPAYPFPPPLRSLAPSLLAPSVPPSCPLPSVVTAVYTYMLAFLFWLADYALPTLSRHACLRAHTAQTHIDVCVFDCRCVWSPTIWTCKGGMKPAAGALPPFPLANIERMQGCRRKRETRTPTLKRPYGAFH